MSSLLAQREKEKKDEHCHEKWKYFSLFVLSVDGILGKEAQVLLKQLSRLMAKKLE